MAGIPRHRAVGVRIAVIVVVVIVVCERVGRTIRGESPREFDQIGIRRWDLCSFRFPFLVQRFVFNSFVVVIVGSVVFSGTTPIRFSFILLLA